MPDRDSLQKMFPIMGGPIKEIPWSVIAPHEEQAVKNHGQSLRRLAERGGLSPGEAWCVLNDKELSFKLKWDEVEKAGEILIQEIADARA